jgi:hypothetical protein
MCEADRQRDVYYNSAILSRLLVRYKASGNETAFALITSTPAVAWRTCI